MSKNSGRALSKTTKYLLREEICCAVKGKIISNLESQIRHSEVITVLNLYIVCPLKSLRGQTISST
jgi:hypothetical protein